MFFAISKKKPMIHFFPIFSRDARESPFAQALVVIGVKHKLFAGEVILRYPSRLGLLLLGWPKVFWFALRSAFRSLVLSRPHPDAVVVGSHIEALVFSLYRKIFFRNNTKIILLGFILTSRRNAWHNKLRRIYFNFVFSVVDKVVCHSVLEQKRYGKLFEKSRATFIYIPYGLHINGRGDFNVNKLSTLLSKPYILTAGRSGRDFATLLAAVEPLDLDLHIVCDNENCLSNLQLTPRISLLRNCYDTAYVNELRQCLFVAIPLDVNDISAGQMVLIQAMAFAKPTIVTRTETIEEYVSHGVQSLLVAQGDVLALRAAIQQLLGDQKLVEELSANALSTYEERFCMHAYIQNLVNCVQQ